MFFHAYQILLLKPKKTLIDLIKSKVHQSGGDSSTTESITAELRAVLPSSSMYSPTSPAKRSASVTQETVSFPIANAVGKFAMGLLEGVSSSSSASAHSSREP